MAPTYRQTPPADIPTTGAILQQAFNVSEEAWQASLARIGTDGFRSLRDGDHLLASLLLVPFHQRWGGRDLPMMGIGGVGVPPEHRGRGAASTLVGEALRECRATGWPISMLYPVTWRPYRKVGFEQAGVWVSRKVPLQRLDLGDHDLPVTPVPTDDPAPFDAIYRRLHPRPDGWTDRPRHAWMRLLRPRGKVAQAWLLGPPDAPEGYVILLRVDAEAPHYALEVQDFLALTPRALRRGWTLLGDHRSLASHAVLGGGLADPRFPILGEHVPSVLWTMHWMIRVVDAPAVLQGIGYPRSGDLFLEVEDTLLPENAGNWRLSVGREVTVERVDRRRSHALRTGPRGLAALVAGLHDPFELALCGHVEGEPATLARAATLFPRRCASCPDWF